MQAISCGATSHSVYLDTRVGHDGRGRFQAPLRSGIYFPEWLLEGQQARRVRSDHRGRGLVPRWCHPSVHQSQVLKRALFLSAFAALKDPVSRTYYKRKRAEKKHNQALIALARRRCDVLFAMLRDGTFDTAPTAPETPLAAAT